MREETFTARRGPRWERLETLLSTAGKRGTRALAPAELREIAFLYRSATTDLAAAQSRAYSADLLRYLNRLTARAYALVHVAQADAGWSRIAAFFRETFPREVRASSGLILSTSALFVGAWIVAYVVVLAHPLAAYGLLPAEEIPTITKKLHDSNFGFDRAFAPAMSSEIITNNIRVTALAFAGGIVTLGVLTIWEILNNGLMVGGLGALFALKGFGTDFWATIAPHGVIELTSIQIAGAAGLLFAQAIVAPGRLRRVDALRVNGRRAGVLMLGVAGLLCVAGTIEGFVTPQRTSELFRFAFGALTAVALFSYLAFAGRPSTAPLRGSAQDDKL